MFEGGIIWPRASRQPIVRGQCETVIRDNLSEDCKQHCNRIPWFGHPLSGSYFCTTSVSLFLHSFFVVVDHFSAFLLHKAVGLSVPETWGCEKGWHVAKVLGQIWTHDIAFTTFLLGNVISVTLTEIFFTYRMCTLSTAAHGLYL